MRMRILNFLCRVIGYQFKAIVHAYSRCNNDSGIFLRRNLTVSALQLPHGVVQPSVVRRHMGHPGNLAVPSDRGCNHPLPQGRWQDAALGTLVATKNPTSEYCGGSSAVTCDTGMETIVQQVMHMSTGLSTGAMVALIGAFVLVTYSLPLTVSAGILASQYGDDGLTAEFGNPAGNPLITQKLGTGLSGTIDHIRMQMTRTTYYGYTEPRISIYCFTSSAYNTLCGGGGADVRDGYSTSTVIALEPFTGTHAVYDFTGFRNGLNGGVLTFDPTKYYVMQIENGGGIKVYCNATTGSGLTSGGPGLNNCLQLYYIIYDNNRLTDGDDSSYVVSTLPSCTPTSGQFACDVASATTSPVTIGGSWHIGNVDATRGAVQVTITLTDLNIFQILPLDGQTTTFYQSYNSAGNYASSSRVTLPNGNYAVRVRINHATGAVYQQSSFIVGSSTVVGNARSKSLSEFNAFVSELSATTTDGYALECALWNISSGSFHSCLAYLFVPNTESVAQNLIGLGALVRYMPPWGYGFLMADYLSAGTTSASTSGLPTAVITLPAGYPGAGATFDLTPWNYLLGPTSLLSTATNPNTGDTLKDIVQDDWNNLVYFTFGLALLRIFTGVGISEVNAEARRRSRGKTSWQ